MPQLIVIEVLDRSPSVRKIFDSIRSAGVEDALLIGKTLPKGIVEKENFISWQRGTLGKAFERALARVRSKDVVVINSECGLSDKQLKSILSQSANLPGGGASYAAVKADKTVIDFAGLKPAGLVPFLASNAPVPALCVATTRELAGTAAASGAESAVEIAAHILLLATAAKGSVQKFQEQIKISADALNLHPLQLTAAECARCLTTVVESCNIEELFPDMPWNKYQEESLAACYHILGALFIRLGDYEQAKEALVQADQLEDSPRSLALKGIVSARKADWLNAAANLIASLQQYEVRIRESEGHFVRFAPKDFQRINSELLAGLDALNHKKNQLAVQRFAEAIFLYDAFYQEQAVMSLKALE